MSARTLFIISLALYAGCLPLDAFCTGACWLGAGVALLGFFGALVEPLADFAWYANLLLAVAWLCLWRLNGVVAQWCAFAAVLVAGAFPLVGRVMSNEGGVTTNVDRVGLGYWVWLASMVAALVSARMLLVDGRASRAET